MSESEDIKGNESSKYFLADAYVTAIFNRNPVPIEKCIFGKILQLQEVFSAPKIILLKKVYLKTKERW